MFRYIDRLKGIGIIGVFCIHSLVLWGDISDIATNTLGIGIYGPYLFFIVSGYGGMIAYEKSKSYLNFLLSRWMRLAPLYILATIFWQILYMIFTRYSWGIGFQPSRSILDIVLNVFLLHGLSTSAINSVVPGGWYVGVLFICYVLMPVFRKLAKWICSLCTMNLLQELMIVAMGYLFFERIYQIVTWRVVDSIEIYTLIRSIPSFLIGLIIFISVKDEKQNQLYSKENKDKADVLKSILFISISGVAIIVIVSICDSSTNFALLFLVFHSCLFISMMRLEQIKGSILIYLGRNSYYIYLTHAFPLWYGGNIARRLLGFVGVNFAFAIYFIMTAGITLFLSYIIKLCERIARKYIINKLTFMLKGE